MSLKDVLKKIFYFFASYGFAVVVLFLLMVLTFFGTLEQVKLGIFEVQKRYFESFFVVHHLFDTIPIVLPGAYPLMVLLFINLLFGGIIRARKDWRHPGMLIAHGGILFLLLAGFVTYKYSISGHMTLYEGERSDEFVSYYDWEVLVTEKQPDGTQREYAIPDAFFKGDDGKVFYTEQLPFEVELYGFLRNAEPRPATGQFEAVDGVELVPKELEPEAERNVAGVYAEVRDPETGAEQKGILWGLNYAPWDSPAPGRFRTIPPWSVRMAGSEYTFELQKRRWKVPFTIALDEFTRELHPGTGMAASFMSDVTKFEGEDSRQVQIKMNEPLRDRGFTFFQSSWGPSNAGPNDRLYSVFSVVNNPADQWPKYACYVIALGLMIHFTQKLGSYLRRESRRRA